MEYYFGIDVGGTTVKIGCFTTDGEVLDKWEVPTRTENNGENILPDVNASINEKLTEKGIDKSQVKGYGMGIPGPVTADGMVLNCVNLGWGTFNIEDKMKEVFGCDNVKAGNDANVAALGESWQGGAKGYDNIVMVTLGTGVGGGVILDGKIVTGSNGAAGEIGHMPVAYDLKVKCNCGKAGCLEQVASATGIVRETKEFLASGEEVAVKSSLNSIENVTAKDVFDAAKDGDEGALIIVDKVGKYLGIALAHIAAVTNPEVFLIGGGVSRAGAILTEQIEKHFQEKAFTACRNAKIKLASLGNDAGIYGAAALVVKTN